MKKAGIKEYSFKKDRSNCLFFLAVKPKDALNAFKEICEEYKKPTIVSLVAGIKSKKYLFDVIISDIAPNTSGNQFSDQANSYNLSLLSVKFIDDFLKKGGHFLVKNFQGEDTEKLFKEIKIFFKKSSYIKPSASDKNSKEIYSLGLEKKQFFSHRFKEIKYDFTFPNPFTYNFMNINKLFDMNPDEYPDIKELLIQIQKNTQK